MGSGIFQARCSPVAGCIVCSAGIVLAVATGGCRSSSGPTEPIRPVTAAPDQEVSSAGIRHGGGSTEEALRERLRAVEDRLRRSEEETRELNREIERIGAAAQDIRREEAASGRPESRQARPGTNRPAGD